MEFVLLGVKWEDWKPLDWYFIPFLMIILKFDAGKIRFC